jgi:hypothetical protein
MGIPPELSVTLKRSGTSDSRSDNEISMIEMAAGIRACKQ